MKGLIAAGLILPALAFASSIEVRRNTVLEVSADQDLSVRNAREGDRFSVTITNDRDLPRGTQLLGEIMQIREKRDHEPASMDLEFRDMILPDGSRHRIQALPIALDNKHVNRGRDGRMYADAKKVKNEYFVFGGMLGGLVVGALIKKPFEGAFIGTLAGILIGEAERSRSKQSSDLVLRRGTRLGAVVLEDVVVDYNDRFDRDRDRDRRNDGDRFYRDDRFRRDDGFNRDRRLDQDEREDRYQDHIQRDSRFDGYGRDQFDIRCGNRTLRFDPIESPYRGGRSIMVPLLSVARQLGLQTSRDRERVSIENRDAVMRLTVGDSGFRLGDRRGNLPVSIEERRGQVYVPLEALAPLVRQLSANGMEIKDPT